VPASSYWLEEPRVPFPRRRLKGRAEVAVIGGGVTGCSCALALAERGVRVRLHEAREIAGGASGRNGGFALRGAAMPYDELRGAVGPGRARSLMTLSEHGLDRLAALAGDAFRRVGSLRLAWDQAERGALRREHDALHADGFAVEWVDDLAAPLDRLAHGAIAHPVDGAIHPARWVRRLARHAAEAGADIREGDAVAVDELDADIVVVAGDGFTASLLPELAPVAVATRGQVLATEPLAELRYDRPHYARGGFDYWHQLPDRRLVLGGRRDASPETELSEEMEPTDRIQRELDCLLMELVGARPRVTHRWAGVWATTPDLLPLVGSVPGRETVWVAGGYSGHGNVLGLVCGELVARAILGERPVELEPFDPARLYVGNRPRPERGAPR
jgi:gamma-glutamylputrescine oxidase